MSIQQQIANDLYKIEAVQINPNDMFTWTSGIRSPIYCDNRLTMSFPAVRDRIADAFIEMIEKHDIKVDVIAGCATAGIPHAAWIAQKLHLPMVYVRSKPKGHGKGNQIEGKIEKGQHVVVIEDLISTGGSSLNASLALRESGATVEAVFAIFSYGLKQAHEIFKQNNLPMETITNYDILLDELVAVNKISLVEKQELLEWRNKLYEQIK